MPDITLYTQEKVGVGLTTVNVCRVKNAGGVRVVSEVAACEYPADPAMSPTLVNTEGSALFRERLTFS